MQRPNIRNGALSFLEAARLAERSIAAHAGTTAWFDYGMIWDDLVLDFLEWHTRMYSII